MLCTLSHPLGQSKAPNSIAVARALTPLAAAVFHRAWLLHEPKEIGRMQRQ
jgi:hypothetical protein